MRLSLYRPHTNYCEFLKKYDDNIPLTSHGKERRPFVGILLKIGDKGYFAPLSSPKAKHKKMSNQEDFLKIDSGKLGVINFNNMIPVKKECIEYIDLRHNNSDSDDEVKYKTLLRNQLWWCNANSVNICKKALNLYNSVVSKTARESLLIRCCDFAKLEKACDEYIK